MSATAIITGVMGLVKEVLPRFVSNKDEAEKTEAAMETALLQAAVDEKSEFRQFILAYEGAASEHGALIQSLRGSVRPVLTYLLFALLAAGWLDFVTWTDQQQEMIFKLNLLSMGFWYGERALKNIFPAAGEFFARKNGEK